jgi:hypothetical protein
MSRNSMMHFPPVPPVPSAVLVPRTLAQRAWARLINPPRFAANRLTWSVSGALVVASIHVITLVGFDLCMRGHEAEPHVSNITFADTVIVAIAALFISLMLFPPFRLSAGLYFFFFERPSRRTAVTWSVLFHFAAHLVTLWFLDLSLATNLWVPLVIAALWGLWLPRLMDRERELGELPWQSPSGRG